MLQTAKLHMYKGRPKLASESPLINAESSYCLYIVYLHKFFIANKHIIIYKYACNLQSVLPQCSTCDGDTNEALNNACITSFDTTRYNYVGADVRTICSHIWKLTK